MTGFTVAFDARHAARGLGISTFVTHLAEELVAAGEVELIWLGDRSLAPAGVQRAIPVHRLPYPALDGPPGRVLATRLGADVLHFTGNTGWGRPGPLPTVLTVHDLIFATNPPSGRSARQVIGHAYESWLIGRALGVADAVAVPSRHVAGDLAGRYGVTPTVIHEGVKAPNVEGAAPTRAQSPYLVAFAGRDPRKRTADVVAGWRAIRAGDVRLRLLASGGLPSGLAEALAPDLGSGRAEILPHVPRAKMWQVLGGALALVYPSSDEGFGLPVLEAMAVGTPVISGLATVTREIGGDALVLLDPADVPGSIAAAVERLLADPAGAAAIVGRGRARATAFTWRATAEAYIECYRTAIARRR